MYTGTFSTTSYNCFLCSTRRLIIGVIVTNCRAAMELVSYTKLHMKQLSYSSFLQCTHIMQLSALTTSTVVLYEPGMLMAKDSKLVISDSLDKNNHYVKPRKICGTTVILSLSIYVQQCTCIIQGGACCIVRAV